MKRRSVPGIHVQYPWSQLILSGKKTVETRSYPLPLKYTNVELAIIETPGPDGRRNGITSAGIIGTVVFDSCFLYQSRSAWAADKARHLVSHGDRQFAFAIEKPKYGWLVKTVKILPSILPPPKRRGIIFALKCDITGNEGTGRLTIRSVGSVGTHALITTSDPKECEP